MNNNVKAKSLLYVCIALFLATTLAVGVSYALFSDSVQVQNHLEAGTLDVTLKRTSLTYTLLNEEGYLVPITEGELDLTKATNKNVFGLDASATKIAPTSYFDAKLAIGNEGNVAFDYSVEIKFLTKDQTAANQLSKQLMVTITDEKGEIVAKYMLSELQGNNTQVKAGHMKANEKEHNFGVRVEFVNLENNNDAKLETVAFDLIVSAVQATEQPKDNNTTTGTINTTK